MPTASAFQRLDAFSKPRQDLRSQSVVGGLITLVASTCAVALLVAHVYMYARGTPRHFLHVSPSQPHHLFPTTHPFQQRLYEQRKPKLPVQFKITFPQIECSKLDVAHDNASFRTGELEKVYGSQVVTFRRPTFFDLATALGKRATDADKSLGCTVEGSWQAPLVAGHLAVTLSKSAWSEVSMILTLNQQLGALPHHQQQQQAPDQKRQEEEHSRRMAGVVAPFNVSHFIHNLQFGRLPKLENMHNPLQDLTHFDTEGLALEQLNIKLIPTIPPSFFGGNSKKVAQHYQPSVTAHSVKQYALVSQGSVPGLSVMYDITPLAVRQTLGRDHVLIFLSSLMSIVGGVFVSVSLITGCLVHATAAAVSKKLD